MPFFVEYKCLQENKTWDSYINSVADRKNFVMEGIESANVVYILAVDGALETDVKSTIKSCGIDILENINSAEILAKKILEK